MNIRAILCAATIAILTTTTQSAVAQQGVKIGRLRCNVSGGLGLIITSTKEMACTFTSARGFREHYYGTIRKYGLDIGETDRGVLAWAVFAIRRTQARGSRGRVCWCRRVGNHRGGAWRERARRRLWPLDRIAAFVGASADRARSRRRRRGADPSPRTLKRVETDGPLFVAGLEIGPGHPGPKSLFATKTP